MDKPSWGALGLPGVASYPRPRGVGEEAVGMSPSMVRWGGLAGVASGVILVLSGILTLIAPPQGAPSSLGDYLLSDLLSAALIVAFALALVAVAGLHAAQSRSGRYGWLGAAGALLTFVGYAIVLVAAHITTLAGGEPSQTVRVVGGLAVLVGSILLGAMTIRARVLPWWCGALLIVGFPLGAVLEEAVAGGTENIVFAIVWGSIGYGLLSRRDAVSEQPARVS
jgi:hypothetical protein